MLSEKIQQLEEGAVTSTMSGHQSHTYGEFSKTTCGVFIDDLFN